MSTTVSKFIESLDGVPKDAIPLDFLRRYISPNSKIIVHPSTGLVTTEKQMDQRSVLSYWSDQVFGSSHVLDYSSAYPYAVGRMHYVINTIRRELAGLVDFRCLSLVDFATGEGTFLEIVRSYFPEAKVRGTEGSKFLSDSLIAKGFDIANIGLGFGEQIDFQDADVATLLWTLSCTLNPFELLKEIHASLSDKSYLVVAESSRILVPFKKSLSDMFRTDRPADIHPNYFSATTLYSSLVSVGFRPMYLNRFHDSDVLLCIAQRVQLPKLDLVLPSDNSNVVVDFFKVWDSLSTNEYVRYPNSLEVFSA